MHCIIYRFKVKAGVESDFIEAWRELTQLYLDHARALGSRLHDLGNGEYLAYAQWPNAETRAKANNLLPEESKRWGEQMRQSCESMETLHRMEVLLDLLQH